MKFVLKTITMISFFLYAALKLLLFAERFFNLYRDQKKLITAASKGDLSTVKYLIEERGLKADAQDSKALIWAAIGGHLSTVEYLIEDGGLKADAQDSQALIEAARDGHLSTVEYLIKKGAKVDAQNSWALIWAAIHGHLSTVEYLIEKGAKADAEDSWALIRAVEEGHLSTVKYLIEKGAKISELHSAQIQNINNIEILEYLFSLPDFYNSNFTESLRVLSRSRNPDIRAFCARQLVVLGFDAIPEGLSGNAFEMAVDASLTKGIQPYSTAKGEKLRSITAHNRFRELQAAQSGENSAAGSESSMDTSLIEKAINHYKILKEKRGKIDLPAVEKELKGAILDAMLADFNNPANARFASQFAPAKAHIEQNRTAIIEGNTEATKKLRALLAHDDIKTFASVIAYRAYDPAAPVVAWPNLFTPPAAGNQNQQVFSTSASSMGQALTQSSASELVRTMVATYYLELKDTPEGVLPLIRQIAEVRRAHNQNPDETDNPSCYPGTVSRLVAALNSTPQALPPDINAQIKEQVRFMVVAAVQKEFAELTEEDATKLYIALTGLHTQYSNTTNMGEQTLNAIFAPDYVVSDPEGKKVPFDAEILTLRKNFIETHFGVTPEEQKNSVLSKLIENQIIIPPENQLDADVLIDSCLLDISHNEALGSITPCYLNKMGIKNQIEEEIIVQANPYNPKKIENYQKIAPGIRQITDQTVFVGAHLKHALFNHILSVLKNSSQILTSDEVKYFCEEYYAWKKGPITFSDINAEVLNTLKESVKDSFTEFLEKVAGKEIPIEPTMEPSLAIIQQAWKTELTPKALIFSISRRAENSLSIRTKGQPGKRLINP